jgi:hypothetical protein
MKKVFGEKVYEYLKGKLNIEMQFHQNVYRFYEKGMPTKFEILHDDIVYRCVFIISEAGGVILEIEKSYGNPITQFVKQFEDMKKYFISDEDNIRLNDVISKMKI